MRNMLAGLRIVLSRKAPQDSRPCAICGLAPQTRLSRGHGRWCLYYSMRVAADEEGDPNAPLRAHCRRDGNHFIFPLVGFTASDLLEYTIRHAEMRNKMRSKMYAAYGSVVAALAAVAALFFKG